MAFKSLGPSTTAFPTPTWIIATYDSDARANAMTAAWGGIANSVPPSVFVAVQPSRYTYDNLLAAKEFTVCIPSENAVAEADYLGLFSGRNLDKIEAAGLTVERAEKVNAPYIKEFPVHLECRVTEILNLGSHAVFAGEIVDVKADESILGPKGNIEIQKLKPIVYSPTDRSYYKVGAEIGKAFSVGKDVPQKRG